MTIRKLFLVALAAALVNYVLPPAPASADGERATATEERDYSQREAESKGVSDFVGGDAIGIVIGVLIIVALVVLIWYLLERSHGHAFQAPRPDAPRPA